MATIVARQRKSGVLAYTAQIRVCVGGKSHTESKTLTDRKLLEQWVTQREAELQSPGVIEKEAHKGTTVGDVLAWYLEDFQRARPFGRTKLDHINFLIRHPLSKLDALQLTPAQLIQHAHSREVSPATILNDFIWLRNAFRAIRLSRDIPLNLQTVDDATFLLRQERVIGKAKQRDRRPTIDELDALLDYFEHKPMFDIILFAIFSGRRQEEITKLLWADFDKDRILVRQMKHPREKRDTYCFLPDRALAVVDRQPKTTPEIFPYKSKTLSAYFTRACHFLEIEDLRFHDLRHEAVSHLFELGWDIPRVSSVSGHKSWGSLQRYTHLRDRGILDKYKNWKWLENK